MRRHQSRWQPNQGRNPLSDSPETVQTNRATSNRVFADYEAIIEAACYAWRKLLAQPHTTTSIRSIPPAAAVCLIVALAG